MPERGPGPIAVVHRVTITTALLAAIAFTVYEAIDFMEARGVGPLFGTAVGAVAVVALAVYLRSLRGLAAKLTPRTRRLAVVLVLALPALARAGAITLETTLRTTVGPTVQVTVAIRNTGSDVAHDVRPRARFLGEERTGEIARQIGPGGSQEWTFDFPRPATRGRFPLLVTVPYADPGFRGFSALSATTVDVDGVFPGRFRGGVSRLAIDTDATMTVTIVNDDAIARKARLGVFLPDELGGFRDLGPYDFAPGKTVTIPVPVRNHGALAGSRYPAYAVITVDDDPRTATLLSSMVDVVASVAIDWQVYLPRAAIVLGACWVAVEIILGVLAWRRRPAAQT